MKMAIQEKLDKFKRLQKLLKSGRKANSELEASKDPMKFIKDNKNMSITGRKGVAY